MNSEEEILVRRYLLGEVDDDEQTIVERRLMSDKAYFQHYLMLEERLTDEYVRGGLSQHEHEQFERHFMLAPERQESVAFARALRRGVAGIAVSDPPDLAKRQRDPERRGVLYGSGRTWGTTMVASLACAILVLLAAAALMIVQTGRLRREIVRSQDLLAASARNEEDLRSQLKEHTARDKGLTERLDDLQTQLTRRGEELHQAQSAWQRGAGLPVVSLLLVPSSDRGENQAHSVYLSGKAQQLVRLDLEIGGSAYKKYRAEVRSAEGEAIWAKEGLKLRSQPRQKLLAITLPGRTLTQNDYLVTLSGQTPNGEYEKIATYQFRVIKR